VAGGTGDGKAPKTKSQIANKLQVANQKGQTNNESVAETE
jgi:hypothetical protein